MRPIRALALTTFGALAGFIAAAAVAKRAVPSRGGEDSDELALAAILDGVQLKSRAQALTGGSVLAWFGGVDLDLSEATLAPEAHLSVHAFFGGVSIRVPPGWRLESGLKVIAGGADVRSTEGESSDAPTLALDGLAFFGGVAIGTRLPNDDGEEQPAA
jgi:Cell wall-active antibiotics response 4TMS YvqF